MERVGGVRGAGGSGFDAGVSLSTCASSRPGGMAEVYEASDGALGRRVAVKVFRGEADIATSQARRQLEIQALALIPTDAGQRLTRKPCR